MITVVAGLKTQLKELNSLQQANTNNEKGQLNSLDKIDKVVYRLTNDSTGGLSNDNIVAVKLSSKITSQGITNQYIFSPEFSQIKADKSP